MIKIFALVAALAAVMLPQAAHAQFSTGQNGVCCAYINDPTTRTQWQLVCNKPALVSDHSARRCCRIAWCLLLAMLADG